MNLIFFVKINILVKNLPYSAGTHYTMNNDSKVLRFTHIKNIIHLLKVFVYIFYLVGSTKLFTNTNKIISNYFIVLLTSSL